MSIFGGLPLSSCGHVIAADPALFLGHLQGRSQRCPQCDDTFDAWDEVRASLVGVGATFGVLAPFGGETLLETLRIPTRHTHELSLSDMGVPGDADVRAVLLTQVLDAGGPESMVRIAYPSGSGPRLPRLSTSVAVHLLPLGSVDPGVATFNLHAQFIRRQAEPQRVLLTGAAVSHGDGDYRRAVIDAHTATDTAVVNALSRRTDGKIDERTRIGFLDKLRVVESLRGEHALPSLPPVFDNALKALNQARNAVAHPRRANASLDEGSSADHLTAALFAVTLAEAEFDLP